MATSTRTTTAKTTNAKATADKAATSAPVLRAVDMVFDKETPGTYRFAEVVAEGSTPLIGTVYLRKSELGATSQPSAIRVTIQDLTAQG